MVTVIHSSTQIARKRYQDDGWGSLDGIEKDYKLEGEMLSNFLRAKDNLPHLIQPGDEYVRQFNLIEGDTCTWRTKKVFFDILVKYDIFDDY